MPRHNADLNLLPWRIRVQHQRRRAALLWIAAVVVLGVICVAWLTLPQRSILQQQGLELMILQERGRRLQHAHATLSNQISAMTGSERDVNAAGIADPVLSSDELVFLAGVVSTFPLPGAVSEMKLGSAGIVLKGSTQDVDVLLGWVSRNSEFQLFELSAEALGSAFEIRRMAFSGDPQ